MRMIIRLTKNACVFSCRNYGKTVFSIYLLRLLMITKSLKNDRGSHGILASTLPKFFCSSIFGTSTRGAAVFRSRRRYLSSSTSNDHKIPEE